MIRRKPINFAKIRWFFKTVVIILRRFSDFYIKELFLLVFDDRGIEMVNYVSDKKNKVRLL